jgi:hypothetical protein
MQPMTIQTQSQLPQPSLTRLALLATSRRDTALLELLTERFLAREFTIVPPDQAEMAVIDGDAESGRQAMVEWQRDRPTAPLVILMLRPQSNGDGFVYVQKPINVDALINTMRGLRCWRGVRTTVAQPVHVAPPSNPPMQFPRPIIISAQRSFTPFASIAEDVPGTMVSVEICMSSDPIVCLAAPNSSPSGFAVMKSAPAQRVSAGF